MGQNFHEAFSAGEIKPPSERSTGFVFAAISLIIAVIFRDNFYVLAGGLSAAFAFAGLSLWQPDRLKALTILWFKFSLLLHKFMNPLIMFVLFAGVMVPAGLVMRIFRDPLQKKRAPRSQHTYWVDRDPAADAAGSMKNQF